MKIGADLNIACPICSNRLSYGIEETVMHLKVINPKTGELLKRTQKRRVMNNETRSFLFCEGDACDFLADDEDEALFGEYFHLFEQVKKSDVDAFSNSVKA